MSPDSAVVARGLVKSFGSVLAVDGIDLEVPQGSVLAVLGPNGAGKTTVVRMLTTVLRPDAGSATVLGHDVAREPHRVRTLIGLAGQFAAVDGNLTARENLDLVGRLTHVERGLRTSRADALIERFELGDAADRPVRTFSGGMRRRLDLAAALVHSPPVLFLDEPTTGLDPRSRLDLWDVVRDLVADGTTVLLTTQYLEEADKLANRIMVIDHGRVIAEGSAADLKAMVGGIVVELRLSSQTAVRKAAKEFTNSDSDLTTRTLVVHVPDTGAAVVDVVSRIGRLGVTVTSMQVREPSLDQVFLKLTGKRAENTDEQR